MSLTRAGHAQAQASDAKVHTASADVGDIKALEAALNWLTAEAGPIDVAIGNAGLAIPKKLADQTVAEAETTMRVRAAAAHGATPLCMLFPHRGAIHQPARTRASTRPIQCRSTLRSIVAQRNRK